MSQPGTFSRGLPKPLLFGLYGAAGGLLGALLLGEPLWALLRPSAARTEVPPLRMAASPEVAVYPGGKNRFSVRVARSGFDGPVTLRCAGQPAGVTIGEVRVEPDREEAEMEVSAGPEAVPGGMEVRVVGAGGSAEAAAPVRLTVHPLPPPPPAIRLAISPEVVLDQGGKNRLTVKVARDHFRAPVQVTFRGGPAGVNIPPLIVDDDEAEVRVEASAAADAPPGTYELSASAKAEQRERPLTASAGGKLVVRRYVPPQVDVLFLLDVTGSMQAPINGVRDGIGDFVRGLEAQQLDSRIGLIAFRDRLIGEEPQVLTFEKGSPFTTDYAEFRRQVGGLVADGGGDEPESSLDAVTLGARQPFREHAAKVLLLITDAPPQVPDKETSSVAEAARVLRERKIDQLHLVVYQRHRDIYQGVQKGTKAGDYFDFEEASKGKSFAGLLPKLSTAIARITTAGRPALPPAAAAPLPPVAPTAAASLPQAAPAPALQGVQSSEAFAADSSARLLLAIGLWTAVMAAGICLGLVVGQQAYLRRGRLGLSQTARGAAGGLAAGLAGGAIGQLLFQATAGGSGGDALFRVVGWTVLGALVGLGMAFLVPNLRADKGLLGGTLGGAAGAGAFLGAAWLLRGTAAGDVGGRLLGAALLGLCLGLMVALVEMAFRKAWLEIEYGPREVGTVNLGPHPVSLGSDRRSCTVFARGAAPVACRFWFRQGKVEFEDVAGGKPAVPAAPGQRRAVGSLAVTVRTAAADLPPPPAPPPGPGLSVPAPAPARPPSVDLERVRKERSGSAPPPSPPAPGRPAPPGEGCPSCGRKAPGPAGRRYCVICDRTF